MRHKFASFGYLARSMPQIGAGPVVVERFANNGEFLAASSGCRRLNNMLGLRFQLTDRGRWWFL